MRTATLILGILLAMLILLQSWILGAGGALLDESVLARGAAIGRFIALSVGGGTILVLKNPAISAAIYGATGVLATLAGAATGYYDLLVWGGLILGLSLLSFMARRESVAGKKPDRNRTTAGTF